MLLRTVVCAKLVLKCQLPTRPLQLPAAPPSAATGDPLPCPQNPLPPPHHPPTPPPAPLTPHRSSCCGQWLRSEARLLHAVVCAGMVRCMGLRVG